VPLDARILVRSSYLAYPNLNKMPVDRASPGVAEDPRSEVTWVIGSDMNPSKTDLLRRKLE
jgi:hypothetical protein